MPDKAAGAAGDACTPLLHLHAGVAHQPKNFVALFSLVHPFAKIVSRVKCTIINIMFSIKGRGASSSPLKDENAEKLNFVASNEPHPLVNQNLVDYMLSRYFGKNSFHWNFTTVQSKRYVSKTINGHFQSAKNKSNSL